MREEKHRLIAYAERQDPIPGLREHPYMDGRKFSLQGGRAVSNSLHGLYQPWKTN
jgi:hypothetical protein